MAPDHDSWRAAAGMLPRQSSASVSAGPQHDVGIRSVFATRPPRRGPASVPAADSWWRRYVAVGAERQPRPSGRRHETRWIFVAGRIPHAHHRQRRCLPARNGSEKRRPRRPIRARNSGYATVRRLAPPQSTSDRFISALSCMIACESGGVTRQTAGHHRREARTARAAHGAQLQLMAPGHDS